MEERHDEIVIYQSEDGLVKVDVLFENETVWLTQQQMSLLFQKDISVISRHIRNIFDEGELDEKSNLHFLQIPNSDRPVRLYNLDVIISGGKAVDTALFGGLPENIKIYPYVDQLEVLSKADVFITHCGMNSVSESLYMATPMALYAQTNEQEAVARRVREIGAGIDLKDDSVAGIRDTVRRILETPSYKNAARECSEDFRSCPGPAGAADFIENAPHASNGIDVIRDLGRASAVSQTVCSIAYIILGIILFRFISRQYLWIYIVLTIVLSAPINALLQKAAYKRLVSRLPKSRVLP